MFLKPEQQTRYAHGLTGKWVRGTSTCPRKSSLVCIKKTKKRERQNKTRREEFKIEIVVMAEKQCLTSAGLGKENHKDEDKYTPV